MNANSGAREDDNTISERIDSLAKQVDELNDRIEDASSLFDPASIPKRVKKAATKQAAALRKEVEELRSRFNEGTILLETDSPSFRETFVQERIDRLHLQLDRWQNRTVWKEAAEGILGLAGTTLLLYLVLDWPFFRVLVVAYLLHAIQNALFGLNKSLRHLTGFLVFREARRMAERRKESLWASLRSVEADFRQGTKEHGQYLAFPV